MKFHNIELGCVAARDAPVSVEEVHPQEKHDSCLPTLLKTIIIISTAGPSDEAKFADSFFYIAFRSERDPSHVRH